MIGLKIINLVKSLFFGQHSTVTCCLLSESFQNQSQCFWAGLAPRAVLPNQYGIVAILHSTRKQPLWQNIWQESCRDGCIQSSMGTSREVPVCQKAGSSCWEPNITPLEKPSSAVSLLVSS